MDKLNLHIISLQKDIPCYIGTGLWEDLRRFLSDDFGTHALAVIADEQVARLYTDTAARHLSHHPGYGGVLTFPVGETSKSRLTKENLEDALLAKKVGRDTVVIALGGGVTGDLAGYVAATLHRGLPLVHMPTSLLAMVDSGVGGKVGINHPEGKNLIGAFYQPEAIFCDVAFLDTLPREEFINGMAEVIKYAAIMDDELWDWLEKDQPQLLTRDRTVLTKIISRCAALKIKVVSADEKEAGYRSILNFGHTLGHALEKLSEFKIKHGFAIAMGMRIAARLSVKKLGYPLPRQQRLDHLIQSYDLNRVDLSAFSVDDLWDCIRTDKKSRRQQPRFSLMDANNSPALYHPIDKKELEDVLKHA